MGRKAGAIKTKDKQPVETIFTKEDFERALEKVSRPIKKPKSGSKQPGT